MIGGLPNCCQKCSYCACPCTPCSSTRLIVDRIRDDREHLIPFVANKQLTTPHITSDCPSNFKAILKPFFPTSSVCWTFASVTLLTHLNSPAYRNKNNRLPPTSSIDTRFLTATRHILPVLNRTHNRNGLQLRKPRLTPSINSPAYLLLTPISTAHPNHPPPPNLQRRLRRRHLLHHRLRA